MERIKAENLSHKVAEIIGERIIRKELLPGERLFEAKIARDLGVSQTTIREAFRILEKRKMVVIEARHGTIVTQLTRDYVESLYDILAELYILLIRKVMIKIKSEGIDDILKGMGKIKSCAEEENGYGYGEAMFTTISILLGIANDALLEHTIAELWQVKRRIEYEAMIFKKKELLDSYERLVKIMELAIAGKVDDAVGKTRKHTQYEKKIALKVIGHRAKSGAESQ